MMSTIKKGILALACLAFITLNAHAAATSIYVAQNATGAATGSDCGNAKPVGFFNAGGNWGSGSAQIGPGTTVHLCGTFTGGPGSTMLTIQGSGSSGSPITILFEAGAQMNAPYWGGDPFAGAGAAVVCSGRSYIILDGGSNGIIQNTSNGSAALGYSNQAASTGVQFSSCSHSEIRNLTVKNIYVHTHGDDGGIGNTGAISAGYGDFISIHNNNVTQAFFGINIGYNTTSSGGNITSASLYGNVIDHSCHLINIGDGNDNASASGINVYNNTLGPHFIDWTANGQGCHSDGMIISAFNSGSSLSNSNFYNNTISSDMCSIQGDPGANCTAWMFFTGNMSNVNIFNNILVATSPNSGYESLLRIAPNSYSGAAIRNFKIYNNVFVGNNFTSGCDCAAVKLDGAESGLSAQNNIFLHFANTAILNQAGTIASVFGSGINHNDYFDTRYFGVDFSNNQRYATLGQWQAAGFDPNGSTADPNLSASYIPQNSSMMALGANLVSLGISALNSDKGGTPRPQAGAWAVGAYQGASSGPAAPTSLTAIVN